VKTEYIISLIRFWETISCFYYFISDEMELVAEDEDGQRGGQATSVHSQHLVWLREYLADDDAHLTSDSDVIQTLESDELDVAEIEKQVQSLMPHTNILKGFCRKCRHLLDHWPHLETTEFSAVDSGRSFHSHEIEAAARGGCKFCAFLFTRLRVRGRLGIFRKIETRLRSLNDKRLAILTVRFSQDFCKQELWLNLPGKVAPDGAFDTYLTICFESNTLSPTGKVPLSKYSMFLTG